MFVVIFFLCIQTFVDVMCWYEISQFQSYFRFRVSRVVIRFCSLAVLFLNLMFTFFQQRVFISPFHWFGLVVSQSVLADGVRNDTHRITATVSSACFIFLLCVCMYVFVFPNSLVLQNAKYKTRKAEHYLLGRPDELFDFYRKFSAVQT